MMRTARFVFIASNVQYIVNAELPTLDSDETSLIQAAARAKSIAALGGADEARESSCSTFAGVCSESEMRFDISSSDHDREPLHALLELDSEVPSPVESQRLGLDAAVVWFLRRAIWLLSFVFAAKGAMLWGQQGPHVVACSPTEATLAGNKSHDEANAGAGPMQSALHKAALAGNDVACELMLRRSPDVLDTPDSWGATALHAAAIGGSQLVVELFLEHGAFIDPVDSCDETPLHLAARGGHVEICKLLVQHGASLRATNAEGLTPLVVAGFEEQEGACRALLALGAGIEDLPDEEVPDILREIMATFVKPATALKWGHAAPGSPSQISTAPCTPLNWPLADIGSRAFDLDEFDEA